MARYRRKRRYRKYRKYKKYYKRYKKYIKPINASSRSRCSIKSRAVYTDSWTIKAGNTDTEVFCFNPFVVSKSSNVPQTYSCLRFSTIDQPVVTNFCNLYDEMKIDGVMFKVTVTTPVGLGAGFDAMRVYSAWDRKGVPYDIRWLAKYPSLTDVEAMPSAVTTMMSNNTVNTFYRYCKASDFFEKFCWCDSTCSDQLLGIKHGNGWSTDTNVYTNEAWLTSNANFIGFAPQFYIGMQTVNYAPTADMSINVAIEMTTYYSFRNPKFGASSDDAAKRAVQSVSDVNGVSPEEAIMKSTKNAPDDANDPAVAPPVKKSRVSFHTYDHDVLGQEPDEPDMEPVRDTSWRGRLRERLIELGVPVGALSTALGLALRYGMPFVRMWMNAGMPDHGVEAGEPPNFHGPAAGEDDYMLGIDDYNEGVFAAGRAPPPHP